MGSCLISIVNLSPHGLLLDCPPPSPLPQCLDAPQGVPNISYNFTSIADIEGVEINSLIGGLACGSITHYDVRCDYVL